MRNSQKLYGDQGKHHRQKDGIQGERRLCEKSRNGRAVGEKTELKGRNMII